METFEKCQEWDIGINRSQLCSELEGICLEQDKTSP